MGHRRKNLVVKMEELMLNETIRDCLAANSPTGIFNFTGDKKGKESLSLVNYYLVESEIV